MNKEKFMQFLSEAIDKGAKIDIHMGQFINSKPVSKSEAEFYAQMFKEAVGAEFVKEGEHEEICSFISVNRGYDQFSGHFSHSPHGYLIEDVNLTGDEDVAI